MSSTGKLALFGGSPVRKAPFPAYNPIGEEEKARVAGVLDSGLLSGFIPRLDTPQDVARALPGLRQARPEIAPALASWGDGQGVGRFLALIRRQLT